LVPLPCLRRFRSIQGRLHSLLWWCASGTQTRDHLIMECAEWRDQQKIFWAEVRKETWRWKSRWNVRDLLADKRCSRAVLDVRSTADVRRLVSALADEDA